MSSLEFYEVLKAFEINNSLSKEIRFFGVPEKTFYFNNLKINFNENNYAVIKGKIPYEVASIIYKKYPGNPYGIRIDGGAYNSKLVDHAIDDIYAIEMSKYVEKYREMREYIRKCNEAKIYLAERPNNNKYITSYHIDSKEGLIIFLAEMKDYLARKNGKNEIFVPRIKELNANVCTEILNKANPFINTYEWMKNDIENNFIFFKTVENSMKTSFSRNFRMALEEFDKAVNPFMNKNIELDDAINYLDKVKIDASSFKTVIGSRSKSNCAEMYISDKKTKNKVSYFRTYDGFKYQLHYNLGKFQTLNVSHYFSSCDDGEVIVLKIYGENVSKKFDIKYNLTTGKAGRLYGKKTQISSEKKEFIYDALLKAIEYASSVTIDNMKKDENEKKLLLENK